MAESTVIEAIINKLVDVSIDVMKKQVKYLCCYSCNVQTLVDEVDEINNKYQSLQQCIETDRANARVITLEVEAWMKKVEDLKTKSQHILEDVQQIKRSRVRKWFPVLHYSLSRKALKIINDSVQLRNINFSTISTPVIPADIPPVPTTSIVGLKSRDSIENRIMDVLKDPSVYSVGIWGIGGVGKTVLAKKIEERVRDEKLFKRVVMVVVSQSPNLPKLQSQIAKELGLTFNEDSLVSQQRKLYQRLMIEKTILIILDDLWESLNLEELGIPSQSTHFGCKLILTSRIKDALISTGILNQNIFYLDILRDKESWIFFKNKAGINKDDDSQDELVQIAKKVERECMGLPLALNIVACALKGKDISFWNNAVRELKKHTPDNIPGVTKSVYGSLLFSIDALESKEQKEIFLLCCLFPEDYLISIEELLRCVTGLRIFKDFENLLEARERVETVLNILLSRSLLLEGDEKKDNFNVGMHDVIRDVGIWITTKKMEKPIFLIKHGKNEWPMVEDDSYNNYNCISLSFYISHNITFPESIVCPKLEFLRLEFMGGYSSNYYVKLPENFFCGMVGLRVLEARQIKFETPSMDQLNNLRTLSLEYCTIFEIRSILGKLINLDILSLRCCEFDILKLEIGSLRKLRRLYILECGTPLMRMAYGVLPRLSRLEIPYGVVSRLARLEELVIAKSFNNWKADFGGEENVACLSELNNLKYLTILKIDIRNSSVVPRQKPLWVEKLKKYVIVIGVKHYSNKIWSERLHKVICLGTEVGDPLDDWVYNLVSGADYVDVKGCNCKKVIEGFSKNSWNLSCLKHLRLEDSTDIQYVFEGLENKESFVALQTIQLLLLDELVCLWKFSIKEQLYLNNLQDIVIKDCDNLTHLFSVYVAQSLVQLCKLEIEFCQNLKEILRNEGEELVEIKFPKLTNVIFRGLDSFCSFCDENCRIELVELRILNLQKLPRLNLFEDDKNEIHQKSFPKVAKMNIDFGKLTNLTMDDVPNIKCLFSSSTINSGLPNLQSLEIRNCLMLEQVIEKDVENLGKTTICSNLRTLILTNLPNICTFCYNLIQLPSLRNMGVKNCPMMLNFVEVIHNHVLNSSVFLDKQVECPNLNLLELRMLNIRGIFSPLSFNALKNLESLIVEDCKELEDVIIEEEGQEFIQKIFLQNFTLNRLPRLYGSVFHMKHRLEFPLLEYIKIKDCPILENFCPGSLHLSKSICVEGLSDSKFANNFFFHKKISSDEIYLENNYFIISVKDISFEGLVPLVVLSDLSETFVDVISFPVFRLISHGIVGKFKIEKVRTEIKYKVILTMKFRNTYLNSMRGSIVIELKLLKGNKLQYTENLKNLLPNTWIEVTIGNFVGQESQQSELLELTLCGVDLDIVGSFMNLWMADIKIVEV